MKYCLLVLFFSFVTSISAAETYKESLDYAHVQSVKAEQTSKGSWCFRVAVRHNDEGWHHYADAWQVLSKDGLVLGERVLLHPHENEQPFTRSLCGVRIPKAVNEIRVRAKCNLHGFGGKEVHLDLSTKQGKDYSVIH